MFVKRKMLLDQSFGRTVRGFAALFAEKLRFSVEHLYICGFAAALDALESISKAAEIIAAAARYRRKCRNTPYCYIGGRGFRGRDRGERRRRFAAALWSAFE